MIANQLVLALILAGATASAALLGCLLDGSYAYEGYTVFFDNIPCNCHYHQHEGTFFGLTAPSAVFMNGAPRPLAISFIHGNDNDREEGEMELRP